MKKKVKGKKVTKKAPAKAEPKAEDKAEKSVKDTKEKDPRATAVIEFLKQDSIEAYGGLNIERKEKHYKLKRLAIPNELITQDEKTATKKLLYNFVARKQKFDAKKNRVGLRTLRITEQWESDYEFGEKIKMDTEPRVLEDTVETPEIDEKYFVDFQTSDTSAKQSEEVTCVAIKDSNVLIKDGEGKLFYTKAKSLKTNPIGTKETKVIVGKCNPSVYRFVGMRFVSTKEKIDTHVEGELYSARVQVAYAINYTNAVKPREKKLNESTLGEYTISDETKLVVIPARVFVKFTDEGQNVEFYILLLREKISNEIKDAYTLCDFFMEEKKKKAKTTKADLNKAVVEAVEEDEDEDEDEL